MREEDLERIISGEGIKLRVNRSIQSEGAFAELNKTWDLDVFYVRAKAILQQNVIFLAYLIM